ncbi:MAG: peroxiredoxin-like family protein [bacterium]|nr:peroxiredoxin-like family protein [bacterium]
MFALKNSLKALEDQFNEKMPAETRQLLEQKRRELAALEIEKAVPALGELAPDFTLKNFDGQKVQLSDWLEKGPVVLSFYRGAWCPYCNLEIKALGDSLEAFQAAGASLLVVSPQRAEFSSRQVEQGQLKFPVLEDPGNQLAARYGLVFTLDPSLRPLYEQLGIDIPAYNGDTSFQLPFPATFVVDRPGKVRFRFVDSDYRKRAEPQEILDVLNYL